MWPCGVWWDFFLFFDGIPFFFAHKAGKRSHARLVTARGGKVQPEGNKTAVRGKGCSFLLFPKIHTQEKCKLKQEGACPVLSRVASRREGARGQELRAARGVAEELREGGCGVMAGQRRRGKRRLGFRRKKEKKEQS
jgi:hypothetical protein